MTVLTTILNGSSGKDVRDTINQLLSTVAALTGSTPLTISGTPGSATQGSAYSFTPTTSGGSGGTKTFSLTGTLPAGLSFSTTTGAITGTPTAVGTTSGLNITVTDGAYTVSRGTFSLVVAAVAATLQALTVSKGTATIGTALSSTISGLTSGSSLALTGAGAAGLSISGAVITGTPTTAGSVNIVETLAGATNSPRTTSGLVTVAAAGAPDGYDVVVLGGQSNGEGRWGPVDATLDATDSRIMMYGFDSQTVSLASDPLDHQDEVANTVGFVMTWAKKYLTTIPANRKVLIVPGCSGGTGFSTGFWRASGTGDAALIARVNAAMTQGTGVNKLVAMLWHQGEGDRTQPAATYTADLDALIARWRTSMTGASATTPFVCGGMLVGGSQTDANIQAVIVATPTRNAYAGYASSQGLAGGGDNLHFSAAAQRIFGGVYFDAYQSALLNGTAAGIPLSITGKPDAATKGNAYRFRPTVAGGSGTKVYTSTGTAIPAGLSLSSSTGIISGTPTTLGSYDGIEITVTDTSGSAKLSGISIPVAVPSGVNLFSAPNTLNTWNAAAGVTVTTNVGTNPVSGLVDVERVAQAAGTNTHTLTTSGTQGNITLGSTYTIAFDILYETCPYAQIYLPSAYGSTIWANFDVQVGAVLTQNNCSASITPLSGGYYRIAMTFVSTGTGGIGANLQPSTLPTPGRGTSQAVTAGSEQSFLVANAQAVFGQVANAF